MLSRRATGRLLFAAAVIALPLPWYLGEVERAPLVRLAFFTGIFGRVMLAEGATGTTRLFFGLGVAQLVLYATALRLLAALGPSEREAVQLMLESFKRPDFREGVRSFLEKRPPRFTGR